MRNICLIALYLICFQAYSQQTIEPDTMKILDWQFFFKSNFKIDSSEEGVVLRYFKNKGFGEKFFPNVYRYDTTLESREKNYLYYQISKKTALIYLTRDGKAEDDICYFDLKNSNKSWIQVNEPQDSVVLKKILSSLYYFELTDSLNMDFSVQTRYVFINPQSGKLSKSIFITHSPSTLKLQSVDEQNHRLLFTIVSKVVDEYPLVIFNYKKMKFVKQPKKGNPFICKSYYAYIKSTTKFDAQTWMSRYP